VLDAAGVLVRVPSEADGRRVYLQLTGVGRQAVKGSEIPARRVLFVCTHNSARSQFAEVLWRRRSEVPVSSAGTQPAEAVHPKAVRVAGRNGFPLAGAKPAEYENAMAAETLVVTVCDQADEQLHEQHLHWSIPDPARVDRIAAFDAAFVEIAARVEQLAGAVAP
jgi:ArsR family transcriptional regulator, arsenate/arsenite/antimonite-responsive transcriptional repressor / arsenate reductase (thioredoxin)